MNRFSNIFIQPHNVVTKNNIFSETNTGIKDTKNMDEDTLKKKYYLNSTEIFKQDVVT